ncbi:MAG: hypothetical protein GY774_03570 [Planctomycetes bacterium]|nr:hypothetical protein [Planctomycetota bacterium]
MMTRLAIYINDPEVFLRQDYTYSLAVMDEEGWLRFGHEMDNCSLIEVVDIDLDINREEVTQTAVDAIDKRATQIRAESESAITDLERRKSELLAIPFIPEQW